MVASASAAPPAAAPGRNHPTYTNMITHALAQLGGASARSAIAGFISASFTGLPVSHDALLTAHLRRLVAEGVLCTSGFSFVFSDHSPTRPAEATDLDSDDESAGDSADDDDDDDAYTPLLHLPVRVPVLGEKRGRGRPRKTVEGSPANAGGVRRPRGRPRKVMVMLSAHTNTTTSAQPCPAKGEHSVLSSQRDGVTKRGRGRPRKIQQSTSPSPGGDPSTACIIKRGPGRPRKEDQQSEATKHLPTPPASRGFKVGCGRPMLVAPASASADTWPPMSWRPIIIDKLPPARCSIDPLAESARVKRPRGRPRIYTPSAAMSAETGDPETVDAASMGIKRGHGWPIKENPSAAAAMLAETEAGDAVSMGIKRGRGRTRKEKPAAAAAAMLAETEAGDAASAGIKRGRGRPRKEKPAAAVAMLAETEAGDAVSTGIKRGRGRPRKEKPAAAMLALL